MNVIFVFEEYFPLPIVFDVLRPIERESYRRLPSVSCFTRVFTMRTQRLREPKHLPDLKQLKPRIAVTRRVYLELHIVPTEIEMFFFDKRSDGRADIIIDHEHQPAHFLTVEFPCLLHKRWVRTDDIAVFVNHIFS